MLPASGSGTTRFLIGDAGEPRPRFEPVLARWAWIPIPILGSVHPIARGGGLSDQDVGGGRNVRMRAALEAAFRVAPPLRHAGGHDHSLQLIEGASARGLVVSGGGAHGHTRPAMSIEGTRFAARQSGHVRVDIQRDGRVRLGVIIVDGRAPAGRRWRSTWPARTEPAGTGPRRAA